MGKHQRRKGARVEREIAALLTDHLGIAVKRQLGAARDGGDDLRVGEKFSVECKGRASFAVSGFLRQAEENCGTRVPLVVLREDGDTRPMVLIRLDDLIPMLRDQL